MTTILWPPNLWILLKLEKLIDFRWGSQYDRPMSFDRLSNGFYIKSQQIEPRRVIETLGPILTDARKNRILNVIEKRTYDVVPVLDGIYDRGNVSAAMRSAEAMGLQEFHVIETGDKFKASSRVTQGSEKWLDVYKWMKPEPCLGYLKEKGYRLVATHLEASVPISEVDFSQKTALVFGNERDGVSPEILEACDQRVIIPMQGFSQSFNISVAAAISFYHIYLSRIQSLGRHGNLTDQQKEYLTAQFYLNTVDNPAVYF